MQSSPAREATSRMYEIERKAAQPSGITLDERNEWHRLLLEPAVSYRDATAYPHAHPVTVAEAFRTLMCESQPRRDR
jgi:hypothetical protein